MNSQISNYFFKQNKFEFQNIREIIITDKMTFDVSSDEWQDFLKNKIMNNIERYFYLIVFAM